MIDSLISLYTAPGYIVLPAVESAWNGLNGWTIPVTIGLLILIPLANSIYQFRQYKKNSSAVMKLALGLNVFFFLIGIMGAAVFLNLTLAENRSLDFIPLLFIPALWAMIISLLLSIIHFVKKRKLK